MHLHPRIIIIIILDEGHLHLRDGQDQGLGGGGVGGDQGGEVGRGGGQDELVAGHLQSSVFVLTKISKEKQSFNNIFCKDESKRTSMITL